jgi:hypothetical protein
MVALRAGASRCVPRLSDHRSARVFDGRGVHAFDALAVQGGGRPVLPLDALFNGIEAQPSAPEYWWL